MNNNFEEIPVYCNVTWLRFIASLPSVIRLRPNRTIFLHARVIFTSIYLHRALTLQPQIALFATDVQWSSLRFDDRSTILSSLPSSYTWLYRLNYLRPLRDLSICRLNVSYRSFERHWSHNLSYCVQLTFNATLSRSFPSDVKMKYHPNFFISQRCTLIDLFSFAFRRTLVVVISYFIRFEPDTSLIFYSPHVLKFFRKTVFH